MGTWDVNSFLAVNHGIKDSSDFYLQFSSWLFLPFSMPALKKFFSPLITRRLGQITSFETTCQWFARTQFKTSCKRCSQGSFWSYFPLKRAEGKQDASPFCLGICASGILKLRMNNMYFSVTRLKTSKTLSEAFWVEDTTGWICIEPQGLASQTPTSPPVRLLWKGGTILGLWGLILWTLFQNLRGQSWKMSLFTWPQSRRCVCTTGFCQDEKWCWVISGKQLICQNTTAKIVGIM